MLGTFDRRRTYLLEFSLLLAAMTLIAGSPLMAQITDEDIIILQQRAIDEGWAFSVGQNSVTNMPLSELCGLVEPEGWREEAKFVSLSAKSDLPPAFDWRDVTELPPIRNQGGCGSCWAFATVGELECAIKIVDGDVVDLSEQYLVSCNYSDWGCGGGWWAHSYHMWKPDLCGDVGSVFETFFPYRARNVACECPYPHTYRIYDWNYIGPDNNIASIEDIKQAIYQFGPVGVAVYVNASFQAYNGGVFNECSSGDINHAVVLVGWNDDDGGDGVWIMRNSWGSYWGESGYMRIKYNCSKIGYAANYVVYPGLVQIATETLPTCSLTIPYSFQLATAGGVGDQTWYDRDGDLEGLGLILQSDGTISGNPILSGSYDFIAVVDDAFGHDEKELAIEIVQPFIFGDANFDQMVNIGDAVYLTNYIFNEGPPPTPFEDAGDANCEGAVNIGDAVYIVNHIFNSGPKPSCEFVK